MATPPRPESPGAVHHVVNRGPRKAAMFYDDEDRQFFLRRLTMTCERRRWRCLSYCLMSNHVHLVVETSEPTLGAGMRDLESVYARMFNDRHGHRGATVEGRYGSWAVTSDEYFAQLLRYVALNPVKAGLVDRPEAWPWSGHAALLAGGSDGLVDARRVAELLEPWGGARATRYARLFDAVSGFADRFGDRHPKDCRPSLAELLALGDRRAVARAARSHGYRLAEIAETLGVHESTVSRWTAG